MIFVHKEFLQRNMLQPIDIFESVITSEIVIGKEFMGLFASEGKTLRHGAEKLHHLG
jgi:hypothetical protein